MNNNIENMPRMNFIQQMHESRMIRNANDQKELTYTDCCERLFLIVLSIEIMRHHSDSRGFVQKYCENTLSYSNFKNFRISGTDLYNFIYFVLGDKNTIKKLKNPQAGWITRQKTKLPISKLRSYLLSVSKNNNPINISNFLMGLSLELNIKDSNFLNIRRYVSRYEKLTNIERKTVFTKLLYVLRSRLRNSDIIEEYEKLSILKDLELSKVSDNEPTVSTKDPYLPSNELALYSYLIGHKNLILVKEFVKLARSGQNIPSRAGMAYLPAIEILHDIITAGPGFVLQLKSLHQRAKNHKK